MSKFYYYVVNYYVVMRDNYPMAIFSSLDKAGKLLAFIKTIGDLSAEHGGLHGSKEHEALIELAGNFDAKWRVGSVHQEIDRFPNPVGGEGLECLPEIPEVSSHVERMRLERIDRLEKELDSLRSKGEVEC